MQHDREYMLDILEAARSPLIILAIKPEKNFLETSSVRMQ